MTVEANKALIRRYIETWNLGDIEELVQFWSPDLVHHTRSNSHNFEETKRIIAQFMSNFAETALPHRGHDRRRRQGRHPDEMVRQAHGRLLGLAGQREAGRMHPHRNRTHRRREDRRALGSH